MDEPGDKYTVNLRRLTALPKVRLHEANNVDSPFRSVLRELFKAINQVDVSDQELQDAQQAQREYQKAKEEKDPFKEKKLIKVVNKAKQAEQRFLPVKVMDRGGEAIVILAHDRRLKKNEDDTEADVEFEDQHPEVCVVFRIALPGLPKRDKPGERFKKPEPVVEKKMVPVAEQKSEQEEEKESIFLKGCRKLLVFTNPLYNSEARERQELERLEYEKKLKNQEYEEMFATERSQRFDRGSTNQDRLYRIASQKGLFKYGYIPRVFQISTAPRQYCVMEYIRGTPLLEWCQKKSDLAKLEFFYNLVKFLFELCHKSGYIHSDIKPKNILVLNELPVMLDFGQSKNLLDHTDDVTNQYTQMLGTPTYTSEESLRQSSKRGFRDEFVPLGRVLWTMFTGREIDRTNIAWREGFEVRVDFAEVRRRYDAGIFTDFALRCFFEKLTAEGPEAKEKRYKDIEQVHSDLAMIIENYRAKLSDTQQKDCKNCKYVNLVYNKLKSTNQEVAKLKSQMAVVIEAAELFSNTFKEDSHEIE